MNLEKINNLIRLAISDEEINDMAKKSVLDPKEFKEAIFNNLREYLKSSSDENISIPKDEEEKGIEVEKEHTPTITKLIEELENRKPTKEELMEAFEGIVEDHERETIDFTGEPEYYKKYLLPMEDEMKQKGKESSIEFQGIENIEDLLKRAYLEMTDEKVNRYKNKKVYAIINKKSVDDKNGKFLGHVMLLYNNDDDWNVTASSELPKHIISTIVLADQESINYNEFIENLRRIFYKKLHGEFLYIEGPISFSEEQPKLNEQQENESIWDTKQPLENY